MNKVAGSVMDISDDHDALEASDLAPGSDLGEGDEEASAPVAAFWIWPDKLIPSSGHRTPNSIW